MTAIAMRERPILFSSEMVKAILDGRKTQTRRVIVPQPPAECSIHYMLGNESWKAQSDRQPLRHHWEAWSGPLFAARPERHLCGSHEVLSPFGQPGDRLWVREKHVLLDRDGWWNSAEPRDALDPFGRRNGVGYADNEHDADSERCRIELGYRWRSPIHMPRWASRLTLEITEVRVQRIQEISEDDAIAEGCFDEKEHDGLLPSHIFSQLWDSLNAKRGYSWEANPWVWAITFKRVEV